MEFSLYVYKKSGFPVILPFPNVEFKIAPVVQNSRVYQETVLFVPGTILREANPQFNYWFRNTLGSSYVNFYPSTALFYILPTGVDLLSITAFLFFAKNTARLTFIGSLRDFIIPQNDKKNIIISLSNFLQSLKLTIAFLKPNV